MQCAVVFIARQHAQRDIVLPILSVRPMSVLCLNECRRFYRSGRVSFGAPLLLQNSNGNGEPP